MVVTRSQSLKNDYFKKNTKESIDMVNKDTNSDMTKFFLRDDIPMSDSDVSDNDNNKNKIASTTLSARVSMVITIHSTKTTTT